MYRVYNREEKTPEHNRNIKENAKRKKFLLEQNIIAQKQNQLIASIQG